jgi:hypothetical protein
MDERTRKECAMTRVLEDQRGKQYILHETDTATKFNIAVYVYPADHKSEGIQVFYEKTGGDRHSLEYANRVTFKTRAEFLAHIDDVLREAGLP